MDNLISNNATLSLPLFPERLLSAEKMLTVDTKKAWGIVADVYVTGKAKELSLYNTPITCSAEGVDKHGNKIKVNSLGRWLFGIPGFHGHVRIAANDKSINLYYPETSPHLVEQFLHELKTAVEKDTEENHGS